jgi:DNA-binding transcriptional regulator YiaG
MDADELKRYLRERSTEIGNCWDWLGATQGPYRMPVMNVGGAVVSVRRYIARTMGLLLEERRVATFSCGNRQCVNPRHVVVMSRAELQARTGSQAALHINPVRSHRLAQSARRHSKLSPEQVAEIRATEGVSQCALGAKYGVSQATISDVRREQTWRDLQVPWSHSLRVLLPSPAPLPERPPEPRRKPRS